MAIDLENKFYPITIWKEDQKQFPFPMAGSTTIYSLAPGLSSPSERT